MRNTTRTLAAIGTAAALAGGVAATQAQAAQPHLSPNAFRDAGVAIDGGHCSTVGAEDLTKLPVTRFADMPMTQVAQGAAQYAHECGGSDDATYTQTMSPTPESARLDYEAMNRELAKFENSSSRKAGYEPPTFVRTTDGEASVRFVHTDDGRPSGAQIIAVRGAKTMNVDVRAAHGLTQAQLDDLAQSTLNDLAQA